MRKIADNIYILTTTRKGRSYTYYYELVAGKRRRIDYDVESQQYSYVRKIKKANLVVKNGKIANKDRELILGSIEDAETRQKIANEIKEAAVKGKSLSFNQIQNMILQDQETKLDRFLRTAGYTVDEFANEYGLTEEEVRAGKFKDIGDGVIRFSIGKKSFDFKWDYEGYKYA